MSTPARKIAKTAAGRKVQRIAKVDPVSGKPMTAVKVVRSQGPSGMYWVTLEDFDGTEKSVKRMLPIS